MLVRACRPRRPRAPLPLSAAALPLLSMGMLAALVSAMRNVLLTYDGWYSPIYLAEENTDPGRTLPRALIGGTVVLIVLYVAINAALLRVLPLSALASSDLPAAAAARLVFPHGGGELVTLISLLTVLSLVNATLLIAPRVLFAIGRDGLFTRKAAAVSASGTPRLALAVSSAAAIALILSGTFEQIIALATVLFLLNYISAYAALFVLRRREPDLPRPYRAFGFPFTSAIVLVGSVLALIAAAAEDPRSALVAGLLLAACAPIYAVNRAAQAAGGSAGGGRLSQSKSVGSPGSSAWRNMRSICAAVVRPTDRFGNSWRAKKATSLVSMLGRALPPVSSQMKNSL